MDIFFSFPQKKTFLLSCIVGRNLILKPQFHRLHRGVFPVQIHTSSLLPYGGLGRLLTTLFHGHYEGQYKSLFHLLARKSPCALAQNNYYSVHQFFFPEDSTIWLPHNLTEAFLPIPLSSCCICHSHTN